MTPLAFLGNSAWLLSSAPTWLRFKKTLGCPEETQWRLLRNQLRRNARCAYGRAYRFGEIRAYSDYAARVPLASYDDLAPWITRIERGENAVLTEAAVTHLIPTSGSTGGRKLIPFTAALQHEFNLAIGAWITDLWRIAPSIALGPAYWSITPQESEPRNLDSRVPVGFAEDSDYLGGVRRRLVDAAMAVPSCLRRVTDVSAFRRILLLYLLRCADLRLISVWHPSFLLLLLDALPGLWSELLTDIERGGCSHPHGLPNDIISLVNLPPLPSRAAQLKTADPHLIETIWPKLSVVSCWGDAHARLATVALEKRFARAQIQPKGLLATEAFVTIPFAGFHPVALRSHFFEFIDEGGQIRLLHELEKGQTYAVVVTTSGGLWRYRLGDHVEVNGFVESTPSLRFVGRGGRVSDRFGEKLSDDFVTRVLRQCCDGIDGDLRFAMLSPDESRPGFWHYTLYLEGVCRDDIARKVEHALRDNPNYALCLDLGQLQPLRIFRIENNAYERFVDAEMARGLRLGNIKPTALSLNADWTRCFKGQYVSTRAVSDA